METISAEIDREIQSLIVKEEDIQSSFYEPLREVDEIRLPHLYPASGVEDIVYKITHDMFSEKPQYEAL
jgi:hypothetical protein